MQIISHYKYVFRERLGKLNCSKSLGLFFFRNNEQLSVSKLKKFIHRQVYYAK